MTAPKALLFDWDNTLVESWDAIHHALVVTFEAMGHEPWSLDETKARVRRSLRDAFPALFGARWEEARKLYLERHANSRYWVDFEDFSFYRMDCR